MLISIKEIIIQSISLYRQHTRRFISYSLLIFIPGACITIFGAILPIIIPSTYRIGIIGLSYIIYALIAIMLSFASFWFSITFIRIIAKSYSGIAIESMEKETKEARVVFWPAFLVSILTGLAVFGGMLLLIIPGIIFALWFVFSIYATVIDHQSPIQAMNTSKQLIDGRWWIVLWKLFIPSLVFGILIVLVQYIITIPLEYILDNTDSSSLLYVTWGVLAQLIIGLFILLLTPLTTSVPTILYTELKKYPFQKDLHKSIET